MVCMPVMAPRCAIWEAFGWRRRWPKCLQPCTRLLAEARRDLAPRVSTAAVAVVPLGVRAPVVARPASAGLPRTHRRALRLVSGQACAAGDLVARGFSGRN